MPVEPESTNGKAKAVALVLASRMAAVHVARRYIVALFVVHTTMANRVAQALLIARQRLGVSFDDDALTLR